jgi:hypothetical protein
MQNITKEYNKQDYMTTAFNVSDDEDEEVLW